MDLVIVESPAKAKTINKYLGKDYKVLASFGHIRDLPAKVGSVLPQEDYSMLWEVGSTAQKHVKEIAENLKKCENLILATDPDREGEAISWHVLQVLKQKKLLKDHKVKRVVFNAITKKAVLDAMAHPRDLDNELVEAYLARRALDYLFGFTLSPILWRKLPGARSAGRVQSVALRLICNREEEIEKFVSQEYWSIIAQLALKNGDHFNAKLVAYNGKKLNKLDISHAKQAQEIKSMLQEADFTLCSVVEKEVARAPWPPFTTSTLQQAAASQLGFSASYTMQLAQRLYEGAELEGETTGLITYMRTDGVQIAPEALEQMRTIIGKSFGENYLPKAARLYTAKAKNAQEAHEAIRPTDFSRRPEEIAKFVNKDQARLYELIWKRALASQMSSARIARTTAEILAEKQQQTALLRAVGSVLKFDGFLTLYADTKDADTEEGLLPALHEGDALKAQEIIATQHHTEPPPRYSEASLIKKLEELGIGRPSTYASTLATLQDREYVIVEKRRLIPHARGRIVTAFLENFFKKYVEYNFTALLEEQLDLISDKKIFWKEVLKDFWENFTAYVAETESLRISEVLDVLNTVLAPLLFPKNEDGTANRLCPTCHSGQLSLKLGRFGAFVGCSNYPECNYTKPLGASSSDNAAMVEVAENMVLGQDKTSGEKIFLKSGRFGPYIQLGEEKEAKRVGIPKDWQGTPIDLAKAEALLSLPRQVGLHPETQEPIQAGLGRFGPYLLYQKQYSSLGTTEELFTVTVAQAVEILAQKKAPRAAASLMALGDHPEGGAVTIKDGRFGPYINWKKVNVTLPKGREPSSFTLEEALHMLAEKQAQAKKTVKKRKNAAKK